MMKNNVTALICILILWGNSNEELFAQQLQWQKQISFNTQNFIGGVSCDSSNNIYVTGRFWQSSGPSSNPWNGFFRAKLDPNGNTIWSDTTHIIGINYHLSMAGDRYGNCYIGGSCNTSFKIGDSLIVFPTSNSSNGFLIKTNDAGIVLWTQPLYKSCPYSICRTSNGSVYVSGKSLASTQFDGIPVNAGGYIAKFNSAGVCQKVIATGPKAPFFSGTDSLNNLYVEIGDVTENKTLNKYTNDSLIWSTPITGNLSGMTVDKNGNTYLAGETPSTTFTFKINTLGQMDWYASKPIYMPVGFVQPYLTSNRYFSIETRHDISDSLLTYLVTYDITNSSFLNAQKISLPYWHLLTNTIFSQTETGDLILGGNEANDVQPINIYKYSFNLVTGVTNNQTDDVDDFAVYPNPNSGVFEVFYAAEESGNIQLNIYDAKGQLVHREALKSFNGRFQKSIDFSNHPPGVYFIEAIIDRRKIIRQLIIQ